ncbi:hypothetical protein [Rhizobium anhuiense]
MLSNGKPPPFSWGSRWSGRLLLFVQMATVAAAATRRTGAILATANTTGSMMLPVTGAAAAARCHDLEVGEFEQCIRRMAVGGDFAHFRYLGVLYLFRRGNRFNSHVVERSAAVSAIPSYSCRFMALAIGDRYLMALEILASVLVVLEDEDGPFLQSGDV